jgi:hypothetical protein
MATIATLPPLPPLPPPLPELDAEDVRAIVRPPTHVIRDDERWEHALGDQAQLALLGRAVLEQLTMELLFLVRPLPSAEELVVRHRVTGFAVSGGSDPGSGAP